MKFIEDLAFGKSWEIKLLEHLNYDTYIQTEGLIKDYDIEITKDNIKTKYEVKVDRMAYNTGNIVIEYECKNIPIAYMYVQRLQKYRPPKMSPTCYIL